MNPSGSDERGVDGDARTWLGLCTNVDHTEDQARQQSPRRPPPHLTTLEGLTLDDQHGDQHATIKTVVTHAPACGGSDQRGGEPPPRGCVGRIHRSSMLRQREERHGEDGDADMAGGTSAAAPTTAMTRAARNGRCLWLNAPTQIQVPKSSASIDKSTACSSWQRVP